MSRLYSEVNFGGLKIPKKRFDLILFFVCQREFLNSTVFVKRLIEESLIVPLRSPWSPNANDLHVQYPQI